MAVNLKTHLANFQEWLKRDTGDAVKWQKERDERLDWYRVHLSKKNIATLSRDDFGAMVKNLWAMNIWHNKDYRVDQLVKDNGLDKLRDGLSDLLYGSKSIDMRWDDFRSAVKGFGPSSLSEILTFHDPQAYALVNLKPYRVLPLVGLSINPVRNGTSYKDAVGAISRVKDLLFDAGMREADFILADFFIAYLFYHVFDLQFKRDETDVEVPSAGRGEVITTTPTVSENLNVDTHESAEGLLLMLGRLLGYDTYTPDGSKLFNGQKLRDIATLEDLPDFANPKIMESVQKIDVVWLKEEWPEYFFEIEHTTGVTSGLLRIYQAEKLSAKFFIIGPEDVLKRYEREVEKAPFHRIKEKYRFRSYQELRDMYAATLNFRTISDRFLG